MIGPTSPQIAFHLRHFLQASGAADVERHLDRLIGAVATDIRRFVQRRLSVRADFLERGRTQPDLDAVEIYYATLGVLGSELRRVREGQREPIEHVRAYALQIAYHEFGQYLRDRYPGRARLRDDLRDLLDGRTSRTGFARWPGRAGDYLCGFARWRDEKRSLQPWTRRYQQLLGDPQEFVDAAGQTAESPNLAVLVAAIFDWVGGPLELEDLAAVVAQLRKVAEPFVCAPEATGSLQSQIEAVPAESWQPESHLEWAENLRWLWRELGQLRLDQRRAFLLGGRENFLCEEFQVCGVAGIGAIARALEMRPEMLAELWYRLPLKDENIARLFSFRNGQEVINKRDDAKKGLARRLGERTRAEVT